jgi:DNA replicative helicase MCM subunit Mcm2 (Cdc46/Mcm family)
MPDLTFKDLPSDTIGKLVRVENNVRRFKDRRVKCDRAIYSFLDYGGFEFRQSIESPVGKTTFAKTVTVRGFNCDRTAAAMGFACR